MPLDKSGSSSSNSEPAAGEGRGGDAATGRRGDEGGDAETEGWGDAPGAMRGLPAGEGELAGAEVEGPLAAGPVVAAVPASPRLAVAASLCFPVPVSRCSAAGFEAAAEGFRTAGGGDSSSSVSSLSDARSCNGSNSDGASSGTSSSRSSRGGSSGESLRGSSPKSSSSSAFGGEAEGLDRSSTRPGDLAAVLKSRWARADVRRPFWISSVATAEAAIGLADLATWPWRLSRIWAGSRSFCWQTARNSSAEIMAPIPEARRSRS